MEVSGCQCCMYTHLFYAWKRSEQKCVLCSIYKAFINAPSQQKLRFRFFRFFFFFFFSNDRKWTDLSWRNFTLFFELPVSWYGRPSKTSQKQYGVLTGKGFWWCFSLGLCTGSILLIQNAILDLKNTFEGRTFCCSFMFQVQMLLV